MTITEKEYEILKGLLYTIDNMLMEESDRNFGEAEEWKFRVRQRRDEYDEWEAKQEKI